MNWAFERGLQAGSVAVVEAVGESPEATAAIWRYLLDIDWLARVKAGFLPVDHPLLLLAAEPRRLGFTLRDGVRVRLLDVKAALSARSYQDRGFVVIEVIDKFCPWNAGRWRNGAGGVDRTDEAPDLRCYVSALGSVYLGGFTWTQLARALRVEEVVSHTARLRQRDHRRDDRLGLRARHRGRCLQPKLSRDPGRGRLFRPQRGKPRRQLVRYARQIC